ncbi:MAG: DUF721 domain-containing protein [Phycisphaerae bacterium]|nr:DUF721 domain-containing protein [Phycisphaerae bacterium]
MRQSPVTMELARLRRFKAQMAPDLSMQKSVTDLYRTFTKQQKAVSELDDTWRQIAPEEFADRASLHKISANGVMTIKASDSATAFEFDRWLRSGGLLEIKQRCKTTVKSVKIEI